MTKIELIKAETEDLLVEKLNKVKCFASQIVQKTDDTWAAFVFIKDKEEAVQKKEDLATDNQIAYMRKLEIPIPENLTKKEASKLIEEKKGGY